MAAIMAPPGLSLPTDEEVRAVQPPPGLELPQEPRTLAPPPGFAPLEHGKKVLPPPGLAKIPEDGQAEQQPKSIFSIADCLGITDDDALPPAPVCIVPVVPPRSHVPGVSGYRELQKTMFEKEKIEKKMQRLEALERLEAMVTCVEELGAIQRKVDSIGGTAVPKKKAAVEKQQSQPCLWTKKESKSHAGKFYYVNSETGKTSWTKPAEYVDPKDVVAVTAKPVEKPQMGLSDYDGSTDAGSSESDDCDSDTVSRSASSRKSSQSPVSSFSVFSADAPVFQPRALRA